MKKWMLLIFVFVSAFMLTGCAEEDEAVMPVIERLAGYITIEGDTLYLDEVEVLMFGDEEGLQLQSIKSMDIAVAINDENRLAELGVNRNDFPGEYYIHNPDKEITAYRLTDETIYSFVDVNLLFVQDAEGDRRYSTTNKEEFIQHLSNYFDPPNPPYIVFVKVRGDKVLSVTEVFLFTQ